MLSSAITRTVSACTRHPWPVLLAALVVSALCGLFAAAHWTIDTDELRIMPDSLPWRQSEQRYARSFPPRPVLVVVQAPTAEMADLATATLAGALQGRHDRFRSVHLPQDPEFFRHAALLFLPAPQLAEVTGRLAAAQPIIGQLAADPSLRGAAGVLAFAAGAAAQGQLPAAALAGPMSALADTLGAVLGGRFSSFSWRDLANAPGNGASAAPHRGFIQIDPILDFEALQPGGAATDAILQAADSAHLKERFGATVRLTGTVPINDQQFAAARNDAGWNLVGTAVAVLLILWLALRSARIILAVALSLAAGFAITAALGLLMVGSFNLISVAFAVLFVGLGADFGIQFSVRYRAERHELGEMAPALRRAAEQAGIPLALATAGTAVGFFSFLPTDYLGMAELGLIAGVGMLAAFATTLTVLPALLMVLNPPGEPHHLGFTALAPMDRFMERHRIAIVVGTIAVVLAGLPLLSRLRFDFDPTHLQPADSPAVQLYHELSGDPRLGIQAINVAVPSLAEARGVAARLREVPEVGETRTIDTLVPPDQDSKLPLIARVAAALGPALSPPQTRPAPSDAEDVAAIRMAAGALAPLASAGGEAGAAASRLQPLLLRLAEAAPELRHRAADALLVPLQADLQMLRDMLAPQRVTVDSLPESMRRDWLAADGHARVQVLPKGDPNDDALLRRFAHAVAGVAPDVSGSPASLVGSEETVTRAFLHAAIWAVLGLAVVLWVTLRRLADVLLTLVPLLVAALVTLEVIALIGQPLNFANIIALPLLLGVGVAFKIYYITAWRGGATHLLQTPLTRAVLYSSLTTATAFGSLWLSSQPGLSSMGELMALALLCTLLAAVLFQPALMGPPRQVEDAAAPRRQPAGD